jgi:acetyl esterase/lipase
MKRLVSLCLGCLALAASVGCFSQPITVEANAQSATVPASELYEVESQKNIAYYDGEGTDKLKHKLDLYLPKGAKDRPVVLFVHGGAWAFGDKDFFGIHAALGQMFARHGLVAVVASYRLSPQVQHPEHVKDVARAFAWTQRNIARYGGRVDQLFVCGHSAGGHLVSLLATDESYLKAEGRSLGDIKGVLSISGVYEVPEKLFVDVFGKDPEVHRLAGPLTHVKAGCPPFLIVWAEKDYPFCDLMSEKFAKALREKKVTAQTRCIKERNHLDIIGNATKDDDPCARELLDFIARQLAP